MIIGILYLTFQITGISLTVIEITALSLRLTSSVGYCPLYQIFNISARKDKQKEKEEVSLFKSEIPPQTCLFPADSLLF